MKFDAFGYTRVRAGSVGRAVRDGYTHGPLPSVGGTWVYAHGVFTVTHPPPARPALAALLFGPTPAGLPVTYPVPLLAPAADPHKPRRWFGCPRCGRKCTDLYLMAPHRRLACRLCLGMTYTSQNESRASREFLKRLKRRAGLA